MQLTLLSPRKSLNKAFLKVKPSRSEIEHFKRNLIGLLDDLNEAESEEHNKNDLGDFLKNTFYHPKFYINTKDRTDLVIHNGPDPKSLPGVLIEAKKPSNKTEMVQLNNLNVKAFHELILYYLRERITNHNLEIKHLVATNIYEWFVFDAILFEKTFAQDKKLVQQFTDFEEGRLSGNTTDFFYREIAEPFLAGLTSEFCFTWFDFRDYDLPLRNEDKKDDSKLIALFKLLSPEHLLKLPFANDSNSLDKAFYTELLHIIGLTETKEGSKKLIGRKKEEERNSGSLIESAIIQLDNLDKISRLEKPTHFGETVQERLFNVALELSITWINRILFLKLLEAQIIRYHKGDPSFAFLNCEKVQNFDDLNTLFFGVLARRPGDRNEEVKKLYSNVPYLNSSLFEPTDIEHSCLFISQLKDGKLPILSSTVLKDNNGKKYKGEVFTLEYLFKFLDAYDFASEGSEEIQEENKTLINASVLGLIFEKINGYKDGSFFTPGFITMYMCRETIRRAVLQKFKEAKGWECQDLKELYNKIGDLQEANKIVNDLKICDPAVGSGHFLVSALNEIIAIKSELKILSDKEGKRLKEYHVEVVNDELIITDEDGDLFEYNPTSAESQRVQETLFHEKQTIIENCLFGVDINPNSVKICRLRLWIELLKNAYYKGPHSSAISNAPHPPTPSPEGEGEHELETLPNIDINIKCGNSLISRYALDADIKQALKNSKWSIESYRTAVMTYRNASSKEEKKGMERLIASIKTDFETEVVANDKRLVQLRKLNGDLFILTNQTSLFERTKKELAEWNKKVADLTTKIKKIETELEEIKSNKIYENAFEWRFEFPEVLNNEGDFVGFDVVMGNPPYINAMDFKKAVGEQEYSFYKNNFITARGTVDIYIYFFEFGFRILRTNQYLCYITPNRYLSANYGVALRKHLIENFKFLRIGDYSNVKVFAEASTYPIVSLYQKTQVLGSYNFISFTYINESHEFLWREFDSTLLTYLNDNILGFVLSSKFNISKKVIDNSENLSNSGIINATSTASEAEMLHNYITIDSDGLMLINTGTIDRYSSTWGKVELTDKGKKFLTPYLPNTKEILGKNRFALYNQPKIIFAKIALRTEAFFDEHGVYASINTNCMYSFSSNYLPYYILGWLNSRLFQFVFECFFDGLKMAGGYFLYSSPNLNNLYIKNISKEIQKPIADLVEQIQSVKNENPDADTSVLEEQVDRLVYELYGLTEEEIKIVEGEK
jgi:hypothetical protein